MDLSDIIRDKRELAINIGDNILNVVYKPSALTAAAEEKYLNAIETHRVNSAYAQALSEILSSWDLTRDGEPVAINIDELKHLPASFLADVFLAIVADNRLGGKETRKNSDAGSQRVEK